MMRWMSMVVMGFLGLAVLASPADAVRGLTLRVADADCGGRILLDLSWPQGRNDEPKVVIKVNGREVATEGVSGGYGGGRSERSIAVTPNAFGRLRIEAIVSGIGRTRRATTSVNFRPRTALLPDWSDSELILGARALRLNVRHGVVEDVLINGQRVEFGLEKNMPSDGTTYTYTILPPGLLHGVNRITVLAKPWRGVTVTHTSTVYFSGDGAVELGAIFRLPYGVSGSRSGPFFQVQVDPLLLTELADVETPDGFLVKTYRAATVGSLTITIRKKAHFLQPFEVERTIPLRITR